MGGSGTWTSRNSSLESKSAIFKIRSIVAATVAVNCLTLSAASLSPNFTSDVLHRLSAPMWAAFASAGGALIIEAAAAQEPIAEDRAISTGIDTPIAITLVATDADGDPLTYYIVQPPVRGALSHLAGNQVRYTPAAGYSGPDSFTFSATDGIFGADATVSITVEGAVDAPLAADDVVVTLAGTPIDVDVLANDSDPNGDPLTLVAVTAPAFGTATFAGSVVTYTPRPEIEEGSDYFLYTIADGTGHTVKGLVSVYVGVPPPEPFVLTATAGFLDFGQVPVNKTKDVVLVVSNDTPMPVTLSGFFSVGQGEPQPFDASSFEGCSFVGDRTLAPGESCTKVVRFWSVPGAGAASPATLDLFGGNTSKTIPLFASTGPPDTGPNVPPVAVDDLSGLVPGWTHTLNPLWNDSDRDDDLLRVVALAGPSHGTAAVISCGDLFPLSPHRDCIQYESDAGYLGIDAIVYTVSDGRGETAEATYHLAVGNVVPSIASVTPDSGPTSGGQAVRITGSNFLYGSGAAFFCPSGILPLWNIQRTDTEIMFTTTPAPAGTCDLHVRTPFGQTGVLANAYTYTSVNSAPVAQDGSAVTDEDAPATIALSATDADGDPLTFTVVTAPAHGTLSGTAPGLTYTPHANYNGSDNFTFRANDGTTGSNTASVSVTVNAVNDAPAAVNDSYSTNQDMALTVAAPGVLTNDTDVEGNPLTAIMVAGPAHGTAVLNAGGGFTYMPTANYSGPDTFTYKATDGGLDSSVGIVSITVIRANTPPFAGDQSVTVVENTPTVIVLGASDANDDALTFINDTLPLHGSLSGSAPHYTYTPEPGYVGPDRFEFHVNDGSADSLVATVSITVRPGNRPPVSNPGGPYTGDVGGTVTLDGTGSSDPDTSFGDSIVAYDWTVAGSIALSGPTPTLSVPQVLGVGTFPVSLRLTDSFGITHTAETTLTTRAPIASFTATPNPAACSQIITFDATATANARPGRTIVNYVWAFGDGGTASGIIATHAYAAYGSYDANLTVTDDLGITATGRLTVVVKLGNLAPVAGAGGPYATQVGSGVSFIGTGSSDPNAACGDSIVSYAWLVNGTIALTGVTSSMTPDQVATLGAGTFPVQLTVTDEFSASATAVTTLTVQPLTIATTTTLQASGTTVSVLQPVTLVATVAPVPPGTGVPGGAVEFLLNGTTLVGTGSLLGGVSSITTTVLPIGANSITARYLGAGMFTGSLSAPVVITVQPGAASSFTLLVVKKNPEVLGSPVFISARVTTADGVAPTGTVEFYDGTTLLGTASLSAGLATMSWTPATTGAKIVSGRYSGDAAVAPSNSPPVIVTIYSGARPAPTMTTLAISPNPSTFGQTVTFRATVSRAAPIGSLVTFFANGVSLGTAPIVDVRGRREAVMTASTLAIGVHMVSAVYLGAPGFQGSNSTPALLTISP